jgi:hypothetical protein
MAEWFFLPLIPLGLLCGYGGFRLARLHGFRTGLDILLAFATACLAATWYLGHLPNAGGAASVSWFYVGTIFSCAGSACAGLAIGGLARKGTRRNRG